MFDADNTAALFTLLNTPEPPDLGPGPRSAIEPITVLETRVDSILANCRPAPATQLIRGTVLLWHDHLDAAHRIAQTIGSPDGSYLHALMHRREPDYWNSKYWWKRVGPHPCFPELARRTSEWLQANAGRPLGNGCLAQGRWDPIEFVDACEAAARNPGNRLETVLLREVQAIEFRVFLKHLANQAFGQ